MRAALILGFVLLATCGPIEDGEDLSDSEADTSGQFAGETYAEFDQRRDELAPDMDVGGFGCTEDCSGHDAGYEWAEQEGLSEEWECRGRSWSFEEGCVAFVREQGGGDSEEEEE